MQNDKLLKLMSFFLSFSIICVAGLIAVAFWGAPGIAYITAFLVVSIFVSLWVMGETYSILWTRFNHYPTNTGSYIIKSYIENGKGVYGVYRILCYSLRKKKNGVFPEIKWEPDLMQILNHQGPFSSLMEARDALDNYLAGIRAQCLKQ